MMIRKIILFSLLTLITTLSNAQEEPAIAVVDFTSAVSTRYINKLPDLIIDRLVNAGYIVVEREKFATAMEELEAGQSGFLDQSTSSAIGRMLGAKLIVTGKILNHGSSKKRGVVYGARVTKTTHVLEARMEVIDLERGVKLFSKTAKEVSVSSSSGLADTGTATDVGAGVARKLVNAMLGSKEVKKAIKGLSGEPELVAVTINSSPEFADIEVDGVYFGEAGNAISIAPGMHTIRVTFPNHEPWEKQVVVNDGMSFTARLEEKKAD